MMCVCSVLKVYLADYGLAYRYCPGGIHREYKKNPKKGHNGTMEYTSLDAHLGVGEMFSHIFNHITVTVGKRQWKGTRIISALNSEVI